MNTLVWTANLLGWPVIQLTIATVALRLPSKLFERDNWLTAPYQIERDHRSFSRAATHKWKHLLPDGASWLGGFPKKKLFRRDVYHLQQFVLETRRAELAHWCMVACLPLFFLWNPPWVRWVMTGYALTSNIPCILVQRYNRIALTRIIRKPNRATAAA